MVLKYSGVVVAKGQRFEYNVTDVVDGLIISWWMVVE